MSRRSSAVSAFVIAGVLTAIGWQQVMIYKQPPVHKVALWFPFLLLGPSSDEFVPVLLTLVQFPLFAAAFVLGSRRWRSTKVLAVVLLSYALCVCAAFVALHPR